MGYYTYQINSEPILTFLHVLILNFVDCTLTMVTLTLGSIDITESQGMYETPEEIAPPNAKSAADISSSALSDADLVRSSSIAETPIPLLRTMD